MTNNRTTIRELLLREAWLRTRHRDRGSSSFARAKRQPLTALDSAATGAIVSRSMVMPLHVGLQLALRFEALTEVIPGRSDYRQVITNGRLVS